MVEVTLKSIITTTEFLRFRASRLAHIRYNRKAEKDAVTSLAANESLWAY